MENASMNLRPHHLLDIVTHYGHGHEFTPHPYGHAVHTVAAQVIADPGVELELVLRADDICLPCQHLLVDGQCDDVLRQLAVPVPKQTYNDGLDEKLFLLFGITPGARMTVSDFLGMVDKHLPGIERICAHPGEDQASRLHGLAAGVSRLLERSP
jgi:hypothetical protein